MLLAMRLLPNKQNIFQEDPQKMPITGLDEKSTNVVKTVN